MGRKSGLGGTPSRPIVSTVRLIPQSWAAGSRWSPHVYEPRRGGDRTRPGARVSGPPPVACVDPAFLADRSGRRSPS